MTERFTTVKGPHSVAIGQFSNVYGSASIGYVPPPVKNIQPGDARYVGDVLVEVLEPAENFPSWWIVSPVWETTDYDSKFAVSESDLSYETLNEMEVLALARRDDSPGILTGIEGREP